MFVVGLIVGGLLSGTVLGLLSGLTTPIPPLGRDLAMVAIAALGLLRELGIVHIRLPQNARQVPQDVLQRNLSRGALQFGFELGTGVRTFVSASAPYVLAFAVLLQGQSLWPAVLAGLGFGIGRAATPLSRFGSGDVDRWDRDLSLRIKNIAIAGAVVVLLAFILYLWTRPCPPHPPSDPHLSGKNTVVGRPQRIFPGKMGRS